MNNNANFITKKLTSISRSFPPAGNWRSTGQRRRRNSNWIFYQASPWQIQTVRRPRKGEQFRALYLIARRADKWRRPRLLSCLAQLITSLVSIFTPMARTPRTYAVPVMKVFCRQLFRTNILHALFHASRAQQASVQLVVQLVEYVLCEWCRKHRYFDVWPRLLSCILGESIESWMFCVNS